jgi:O-acetylhomoserine (thiol)-lyase
MPLIVDNTTASPYLCRPIEHGATLVVHSATKYLTGNGTVTGGSWSIRASSTGRPTASSPRLPARARLSRARLPSDLGGMAFTFHSIAVGLRDLGMTMNPQGAHYTLMGIETLACAWSAMSPTRRRWRVAGAGPARRLRHLCRAQVLALPPPGGADLPKGRGALFTFAVKGGYEACVKLVDNLKLFSHVANLGDTRS